ncbi:MAG: glycosyltransferase [Xanthomonadales bacterium]|nr:glycosyltransferase [Xanthomonadales bacterium]
MQIVVLGMHRSGTSLLSGLLESAGIYFGASGEFIAPNNENPKGFWERKDIRYLNDQLLHSVHCDWSEISGLGKANFPEDLKTSCLRDANSILANLTQSSTTGLVGIKEPRFCVLIDFWLQVLSPERFFILVNRDIDEIALSLKTRNKMPPDVACYLTERYLGYAIKSIQDEHVHVTNFSKLVSEPQTALGEIIQSIDQATGTKLDMPNAEQISTIVRPDFYRSKVKNKSLRVSANLSKWHAQLSKGNLPEISSVSSLVPKYVLSYERDKRFSEFVLINTRFKRLETQFIALNQKKVISDAPRVLDELAKNRKQIASLKEDFASIFSEKRPLQDELKNVKKKLEIANSEIGNLGIKIANIVDEKDQTIKELNKKIIKNEEDLDSKEAELEKSTKKLSETESQLQASISDLEHVNEQLETRESELEKSTTERERLQQLLEKILEKQEKFRAEKKKLRQQLTKSDLELRNKRERLKRQFDDLSLLKARVESNRTSLEQAEYAYRKVRVENRALQTLAQSTFENLDLLFSSRTWWLSSKFIRFMLNPLRRDGGVTVLDELEENRKKFEGLNRTVSRNVISAGPSISKSELTKKYCPEVSVVVLNRDGESHLEKFFSSYLEHHDAPAAELIIVDHGSKDQSLDIIEEYMAALPITLISFPRNHSFAHSNNYAARHASGKFLIFANNDIVFCCPVVNELVSELNDPAVGLAGLPLYYPAQNGEDLGKLQHAGIRFCIDEEYDFARPVNRQSLPVDAEHARNQPAVTAALVACRKSDFEDVGGFHEGYDYGYEDIDLSLSFKVKLNKAAVLSDKTLAIHNESASQKKDRASDISRRRKSNITLLRRRYGNYIEKKRLVSKLNGGAWSANPFRVGLVVTDDDPNTRAGDFFTAQELALAMTAEFGWMCSYLPQLSKTKDWYDVSDLDCIIVLIDNYDLSKVHGANHRLLKIAWLRNWFDRWVDHAWFSAYDLCLCSSAKAREFVSESSGKHTHVLKIATNPDRFKKGMPAVDEYLSDYCFTGSYWGSPREIENLDPAKIPHEFALYGQGWEKHPQFAGCYRGSLPYGELPAVYASTKILVDDANHVTKPWGSVNSRVFDALAAGVLVITNGEIGAVETFGDFLPTYGSIEDLENKINYFMENPEERESSADILHQLVISEHTYVTRAHELKGILEEDIIGKPRIAIKLPVPRAEEINVWGDYHLGRGLAKSLRELGYAVRLDIMPDWYTTHSIPDDIVFTIRGLSEYSPDERHVNVLWQISHPDKVKDKEYEQYDHVFVASEEYANLLKRRISTPVSVLLQCADPEKFSFNTRHSRNKDVVFVGNSRKKLRPIVKDAIAAGLDLKIHGSLWENLVDKKFIAGQHIANEVLGEFYASSGVVLNDHWETMQQHGFISNRLFDAAACGAVVVSDHVKGIDELFEGLVYVYSGGPTELLGCVRAALSEDDSYKVRRADLARKIREEHSFDARALEVEKVLVELVGNKSGVNAEP